MAEGGKTVCPACLSSSCRGGSCKYTEEATRNNVRNIVCNFFKKGICKYGDNCYYPHSTDSENINSILESRYNEHTSKLSCQRTESHSLSNNVNAVHNNLQNFDFPRTVKKTSGRPDSPDWVKAPEFVPKSSKTYSDAVKLNNSDIDSQPLEFCAMYLDIGKCPYGGECPCIHGDFCELCRKYCLIPFNELQRNRHIKHCCVQELELDMELSFAIQRSEDKECGICKDVIMEKATHSERFFGILENCKHVFCLTCIRTWRNTESDRAQRVDEPMLDTVVTRLCPECRTSSNFITPSKYWVDTEEDKEKLIAGYKLALSKKPCKYFKYSQDCPFGGACFYLHAKSDGTKVVLPFPTRRRRQNQDGEFVILNEIDFWNFLEARDNSDLMS